MRVLVTGNRGFIGGHVMHVLAEQRHEAIGWDRKDDLHVELMFSKNFNGVNAVIHLAAKADISQNWVSDREREQLFSDNVEATWHMLEAMRGTKVHSVVFASTAAVYGSTRNYPACEVSLPTPVTSPYAATKVAGEAIIEAYCHEAGRRWYNARLVSCVGSGYRHGHVADFVRMAKEGPIRAKDDGSHPKSQIHVRDAAEALVMMATHDIPSGTYNVSSGELWSWKQTIEEMGDSIDYEYIAREAGWIGDPVGLQVYGGKLEKYFRPTRSVRAGVREALADLGWRK